MDVTLRCAVDSVPFRTCRHPAHQARDFYCNCPRTSEDEEPSASEAKETAKNIEILIDFCVMLKYVGVVVCWCVKVVMMDCCFLSQKFLSRHHAVVSLPPERIEEIDPHLQKPEPNAYLR